MDYWIRGTTKSSEWREEGGIDRGESGGSCGRTARRRWWRRDGKASVAKPPGGVGKAAGVASDVDKKGAVGGCRGFLRPRAAAWWEEEKKGSETDRQLCCLRRRPAESLSRSSRAAG